MKERKKERKKKKQECRIFYYF